MDLLLHLTSRLEWTKSACVFDYPPPSEGWPAPAPRDSELSLPLQIDLVTLLLLLPNPAKVAKSSWACSVITRLGGSSLQVVKEGGRGEGVHVEENHSEEASETRRRTVLGALERVGARWSGGAESGAGGLFI